MKNSRMIRPLVTIIVGIVLILIGLIIGLMWLYLFGFLAIFGGIAIFCLTKLGPKEYKYKTQETPSISPNSSAATISQDIASQVDKICPVCGSHSKGNFCLNCGEKLE